MFSEPGDTGGAQAERAMAIVRECLGEFPFAALLSDPPPRPEYAEYLEWLSRGDQGEMEYMARTKDRRRSLGDGYPGYRSVLMALLPSPPVRTGEHGALSFRVARYSTGPDYHRVFEERFRRVRNRIRRYLDPGDRPLIKPDHGSLMEKSLAAEAGLGQVGKNTLLINPVLGSQFTIGSMIFKTPLATVKGPFENFSPCGSCRRCLDACPTGAFRGPYRLKADHCLSYLTIERPDSPTVPIRLRSGGNWLFGCDVCQDVCPYNAPSRTKGGPADPPMVVNSRSDLIELAEQNPALRRVGPDHLWKRLGEIREAFDPRFGTVTTGSV